MQHIYIYGASGHGLVVADIALACGYDEVIFIDDGENGYPSFEDIQSNSNIPLAFGIGLNKIRALLFEKVSACGFDIVTLIHPSAVISKTATIQNGTVVMPNVVVNANTSIGKGVILNTACVIEHENSIEDFVHISPNCSLAGNITIEKNTHIGIGSCLIQGITIGENCIIGAGSVVVKSIEDNTKAYGNPCKIIKRINE